MDADCDCNGCGDCGSCDCHGCDCGDCFDACLFCGPMDGRPGGKRDNGCGIIILIIIAVVVISSIGHCVIRKSPKEIKQEIASTVHSGIIVDTYWSFRMFAEDSTTVVEDADKHRWLLKGKRGKKGDEITFTEGETLK